MDYPLEIQVEITFSAAMLSPKGKKTPTPAINCVKILKNLGWWQIIGFAVSNCPTQLYTQKDKYCQATGHVEGPTLNLRRPRPGLNL